MMRSCVDSCCIYTVYLGPTHNGSPEISHLFSFQLRNLYSYSLETAVVVLFGREVEMQNGVKDEFTETPKVAFKGRETDIPFMVTSSLIQC